MRWDRVYAVCKSFRKPSEYVIMPAWRTKQRVYDSISEFGHDRRIQGKAHSKVGRREDAAARRVVREGTVALWEIH